MSSAADSSYGDIEDEDSLESLRAAEILAYELALADINLIHDLKAARIQQGISEEELARRLGISVDFVRIFESNQQRGVELATVRRYAHALGVRVTHTVEIFDPSDRPREL